MTILLDSGPLGLVTNPKQSPEAEACRAWLEERIQRGDSIAIPEIADYEVRRELLRAGKTAGLRRLDLLATQLDYLLLTTEAMRRAAEFWAEARRQGRPTASPDSLDGDVILAGQAAALRLPETDIVVATTNPGHLTRFVAARLWQEIAVPNSNVE